MNKIVKKDGEQMSFSLWSCKFLKDWAQVDMVFNMWPRASPTEGELK